MPILKKNKTIKNKIKKNKLQKGGDYFYDIIRSTKRKTKQNGNLEERKCKTGREPSTASHTYCEIDDLVASVLGRKLKKPLYSFDKMASFDRPQDKAKRKLKNPHSFDKMEMTPDYIRQLSELSHIPMTLYSFNNNPRKMYLSVDDIKDTMGNIEIENSRTIFHKEGKWNVNGWWDPLYEFKIHELKENVLGRRLRGDTHVHRSIKDLNAIIEENFKIMDDNWIKNHKDDYNAIFDGQNFFGGSVDAKKFNQFITRFNDMGSAKVEIPSILVILRGPLNWNWKQESHLKKLSKEGKKKGYDKRKSMEETTMSTIKTLIRDTERFTKGRFQGYTKIKVKIDVMFVHTFLLFPSQSQQQPFQQPFQQHNNDNDNDYEPQQLITQFAEMNLEPKPEPAPEPASVKIRKIGIGGKKKVRKHQGINQTGGNAGRLRKGYKYSGKKLKSGLPQIIKCKSKKC
jgi:hypothetical protein